MGKKGGAFNFKKAIIDHQHLLDKLKKAVKDSDCEHPFWLHDYESLGKSCAPRVMSLYHIHSILEALIAACPELAIRYSDT